MVQHRLSPIVVLVFLATAVFLVSTVALMLGPLLIELAHEFHTSVAVTGQLAAATGITWALTAFLAGPVSDMYGRRLMLLLGLMLMMLETLSAALARNYSVLLACRFLTGVGAAMIPANSLATVADILPPDQHGKAVGWLIGAGGLGTAFGIPMVALLTEAGGWRLPFYGIGTLLLTLWVLLWVWFPSSQQSQALPFVAHVRAASANAVFWYVLTANCLQVMAFMGMSSYLAAYLMQSYRMTAGETALPLTLAGLGVVAGSLLGGRVASYPHRLVVVALSFAAGGLVAALVFTLHPSPWLTVGLAFGVAALLTLSWPVTAVLVMEAAGQSRATATGMFAVSNQLGMMGGASLGGLMLSLGHFPWGGRFAWRPLSLPP
jgi:predicted MFS family arabinose efflux permease